MRRLTEADMSDLVVTGAGVVVVLSEVPNNSLKTSLPGKFCPVSNEPLDALALESAPPRLGSSASARATAEAVAASRAEGVRNMTNGAASAKPVPASLTRTRTRGR